MTILTRNLSRYTSQSTQVDHEAVLIASLQDAMIENGIPIDQAEIANFLVALKSKPLAVMAGPALSGKEALVQSLAQTLSEQERIQIQLISGHPWWAKGGDGLAHHTGLHTRFITEKILALVEEASLPKNSRRIFVACLIRMSPAELLSFFTNVAFQLQHGQIMRLGDTHFSEPIAFPSNLRIVGTMDTPSFNWWENDLLQSTTIIQWPQTRALPELKFSRSIPLAEFEFLQSCIRDREVAYAKVFPVLKKQRQPLYPLLQVETILKKHISHLETITDEVMIYLANSWSMLGNGLFHPLPDRNLTIALDLALVQILLPRAVDAIQSLESIRNRLRIVLGGRFLRSAAFIAAC